MSGSKEEVMETLRDLPEILMSLSSALDKAEINRRLGREDEVSFAGKEEYPTVSLPPNASCPDVIVNILSTEWGRKTPRTLNDLMETMKLNALHYPKGTVSGRLADMTKKGVLRRVQTERGYGYILIKDL